MPSTQDRRRLVSSDCSLDPIPPSVMEDLELLDLLDESTTTENPADPAPENQELSRMLSLHTRVPTSFTAAKRDDEAQATGSGPFRKIGAGACGLIFAQDGKSLVYKLAKVDNDELWNDRIMHERIAGEFYRFAIDEVKVPECYYFIPQRRFGNNPELVDAAKDLCNLPTCALITERIPPLPSPTRHQLIEKYCSPRIKKQAHADPAN
ncbi:hypothetical protein B0J18DRAFT_462282 [Chaetomium sp. MPI-SDFR-AT-0129]|nr:hypothetical protein B0J18DRAFT_462282 [Chaetomium sp. MPI-SDFR-AT-0129]